MIAETLQQRWENLNNHDKRTTATVTRRKPNINHRTIATAVMKETLQQ